MAFIRLFIQQAFIDSLFVLGTVHYTGECQRRNYTVLMVKLGFPGNSVVKNPPANTGDTSLIPESGKIPWRRKWQPWLENSSGTLGWRIPWTEELGGLQSMGRRRVWHDLEPQQQQWWNTRPHSIRSASRVDCKAHFGWGESSWKK